MPVRFIALETNAVDALRAGAPDANGQPAETQVATPGQFPCRHCLGMIRPGERFHILAHRPFSAPQPYAEVGPIFLHAENCPRGGGDALPAFLQSPRYLIRGYGRDDRIVYGSGQVVETQEIPARAEAMFADGRIDYIHVRSASNNCYHCRIERG